MSRDMRSPGWQLGKFRLVMRGGARRGEAGGALLSASSRRGGPEAVVRAVAFRGRPRLTLHELSPADTACSVVSSSPWLNGCRLEGWTGSTTTRGEPGRAGDGGGGGPLARG